jgi:hypothetical protein
LSPGFYFTRVAGHQPSLSTKQPLSCESGCKKSAGNKSYLPSIIPPGSPFSQLLGVFHGRSAMFSGSLPGVAQPATLSKPATATSNKTQRGLMERSKFTIRE